jgi:acyl-coenzyme A thioesterase PaaI-like protein
VKLDVDDMCFACGQRNPVGLKLQFNFDGDDYVTALHVQPEHQGWAGIIHGGLLATALDETMARLLWEKDLNAITGRLEVRYHEPVRIGDSLRIRARITRRRPPVIETAADALNAQGATVAEARAVNMEV